MPRFRVKPQKMRHKLCRKCTDEGPKFAAYLQDESSIYCEEHSDEECRDPVSIPDLPPICPRCLDVEPGVPSGDLSIANPSAEALCVSCSLVCAEDLVKERGPLARHTSKITERLAPYAVASRPLQPWPRPGMPDIPDGPSRLALGPKDFEGLGREKFWDQSPEERAKALPAMVEDSNLNIVAKVGMAYIGTASENKAFAKGWLNELQRVSAYKDKDRKK